MGGTPLGNGELVPTVIPLFLEVHPHAKPTLAWGVAMVGAGSCPLLRCVVVGVCHLLFV
jgi:hypothetical protein